MARVSIIIPAYNAAQFIARTLESALAQTYKDTEIIVVDDGSKDATAEIAESFGSRVLCRRQQNGGVSAARNHALSLASGELIAYLDADDMWYPTKLEKQVEYLDAHPSCGLVHTDVDCIDVSDQIVHAAFNKSTQRPVPCGSCLMDLLQRSHVQLLTVMVRRNLVDQVGRFDERLMGVEDYMQFLQVAMTGAEFGYLDEPLALYRWTPGSISSNEKRMRAGLIDLFTILLEEKALEERCGREAAALAREQIYARGRELAYLLRCEGQRTEARQKLRRLMGSWPLRFPLYADWAKTYLPI